MSLGQSIDTLVEAAKPIACQNCRFWNMIAATAAQEVPSGFCMRYPPTPFFAGMANSLRGDVRVFDSSYPPTNALNWCGEFTVKE